MKNTAKGAILATVGYLLVIYLLPDTNLWDLLRLALIAYLILYVFSWLAE